MKLQIKLQENLLGTMIDNRLTFETHMESLCKEAGQKLHALARIANYMDISKRMQHYECINPFKILILPADMDVSH